MKASEHVHCEGGGREEERGRKEGKGGGMDPPDSDLIRVFLLVLQLLLPLSSAMPTSQITDLDGLVSALGLYV